jgi:hypothetical protein
METVRNTSIQSSDYRDLPIRQLVESPPNPRNDMTNRRSDIRTHHGESCKAREVGSILAEQRKQEERRKEDFATRRRILSAILGRVSAPLTRADLDLIACEFRKSATLGKPNHPWPAARGDTEMRATEITNRD